VRGAAPPWRRRPAPIEYGYNRPIPFRQSPGAGFAARVRPLIIMARLSLQFPADQYCYSVNLAVRITDINGANHLGNDSMISMISEARARFLFDFGIRETDDNRVGIIVTDLATTYRAEAYARDELLFEVGVMDFNRYGGDIIFRITRPADGAPIAMAKSGFVFFDYRDKKVVAMPEGFAAKFPKVNRI
jgi:acyl-CoA thioesterase FadM